MAIKELYTISKVEEIDSILRICKENDIFFINVLFY